MALQVKQTGQYIPFLIAYSQNMPDGI